MKGSIEKVKKGPMCKKKKNQKLLSKISYACIKTALLKSSQMHKGPSFREAFILSSK